MAQFPQLSNREWDVVKNLLQGKSNKLIALSLGISGRTVEFHLKNIYAKFQVSSRIELILKLGNATGGFKIGKPGYSTVAGKGENAENRDRLNSRMGRAATLRNTISMIGKELRMKDLLKSRHVLLGMVTALLTGFLWVAILEYSRHLSAEDFTVFTAPLVIVLAMIGLIVGVVGKRRNESLFKVLFSVIFGTGLSPFTVIPIMMFVVVPVGRFVASLGMIDPSTIPGRTASAVAMGIMITLWLVVGITFGIVTLLLSINKQQTGNHSQSVEST